MGFDDLCNTVLGLGFSSSTTEHHKSLISPHQPKITFEPSLTLTLSGETNHSTIKKINDSDELYSGAASSFSSVKREREMISEQKEIERVSLSITISDIVEDEDGGINGRKKLRLTKAQSALLEENFKKQSSLNPKQKQELARGLKLRPRQVEVWFQNRRARFESLPCIEEIY